MGDLGANSVRGGGGRAGRRQRERAAQPDIIAGIERLKAEQG